MVEDRWLRVIGPGVIAASALAAIGSGAVSGPAGPSLPLPCEGGGADRVARVRSADPPTIETIGREAQARLDPVLDAAGSLSGQRLVIGRLSGATSWIIELPSESFAAGPFGHIVLVGSDDGTASTLETVDVETGCVSVIVRDASVIRRATIAPDGATVFETRVDRASRADLGVWRRPLDASRPAERVLDPIAADPRFGRTWSTEFSWSIEGDRLAVQSCGATACRTRVLEPGNGSLGSVTDPTLGPLVGLTADRLATFGACRGFPCPLVIVDSRNGDQQVLEGASGPAVLTGRGTTPSVVLERRDDAGQRHLVRVDPATVDEVDLGAMADGLDLRGDAATSGLGSRVPAGWVLLVPDVSAPATVAEDAPVLRRVSDGAARSIDEVTP